MVTKEDVVKFAEEHPTGFFGLLIVVAGIAIGSFWGLDLALKATFKYFGGW